MAAPGDIFQHNTTHEIVRVEEERGGLLSFSVLRQGKWQMCPNVWDSEEFELKFTKLHLREVLGDRSE